MIENNILLLFYKKAEPSMIPGSALILITIQFLHSHDLTSKLLSL